MEDFSVGFGKGAATHILPNERFWIKGASLRLLHDAVLHTVNLVAGGDECLIDSLKFCGGDSVVGGQLHGHAPERAHLKLVPIDGRAASHDAVIVFRKTLRLREALPPTRRAA